MVEHRKKDWGEELYDKVRNAVDEMDFDGLSASISDILHMAGDQMGDVMTQLDQQAKKLKGRISKKSTSGQLRTIPGRYTSGLEKNVGMVGMGISGFALFIMFLEGIASDFSEMAVLILCIYLPVFLLFGVTFLHGRKVKMRTQRLEIYQNCWRGLPFIMLDKLSVQTGIDENVIKEDVNYILEQHLLMYGMLDESGTCLLLTEEATSQYELARMSFIEREEAKKHKETTWKTGEDITGDKDSKVKQSGAYGGINSGTEQDGSSSAESDPVEKHYLEFEAESRKQEQELYQLKSQIQDKQMYEKVDLFTQNFNKILLLVEEKHELSRKLDRLNAYYVPSVLKLLHVYLDLENKPMETENIVNTKQEILRSIDMMNEALLKLYDDLFQSMAMDVNADVKVMEMLLKKDGLIS